MSKVFDFRIQKIGILASMFLLVFSGCLVRTYTVIKERQDLEVAGNQGYLMGKPSGTKEREIKTRNTYVMEVELGKHSSPQESKIEEKQAIQKDASSSVVVGKDYMFEEGLAEKTILQSKSGPGKTYVVKQGDTLEKIAARPEIYGDKKKWYKIYKANKDKLKNPDKILPGQVLQIPD